ncbi:site-2 protease family protein [uncultured Polaribacter sp.]|uniref:site-2 protease family protein n=1 Tax=uncultured Polaribacter sp. TaxID=174711 RepID=UPI0026269231|nr:site-2 protease family protein [uncultured Polaribacter sp.]
MKANLSLGSIAGIKINVHWTFFLLIVWIVFDQMKRGGNTASILYNIAFILTVFVCVILHELGHALMAKRFKIKTKKITLLPIGGIASLERIPESPKQEFLVAIAGPLVNVCIAALLFFTIPIHDILNQNFNDSYVFFSRFTLQNFLFYLFLVNVGLVLFNMIPAFPMDGGRVLRSALAMKMNRVKATQIAASTGQFFAVLFLIFGLLYNPILIFIALFIFLGAYGENQIVNHLAILNGHKVQEAMMTNITTFNPNDTINKVLKTIISGTENNFIVLKGAVIIGVLYHKDIIENSHKEDCLVKDMMTTKFTLLKAKDDLKKVYELIYSKSNTFFPVVKQDELIGVIDAINLNEYLLIQAKLTH